MKLYVRRRVRLMRNLLNHTGWNSSDRKLFRYEPDSKFPNRPERLILRLKRVSNSSWLYRLMHEEETFTFNSHLLHVLK